MCDYSNKVNKLFIGFSKNESKNDIINYKRIKSEKDFQSANHLDLVVKSSDQFLTIACLHGQKSNTNLSN